MKLKCVIGLLALFSMSFGCAGRPGPVAVSVLAQAPNQTGKETPAELALKPPVTPVPENTSSVHVPDRTNWWNPDCRERERLTVKKLAKQALPADYSVSFYINHKRWVSQGRSLKDGSDVRIVHFNGVTFTEVSRVVDGASDWNHPRSHIWFSVAAPVPALSEDTGYFIYFNNRAPARAQDHPANIFLFSDNFDDGLEKEAWNLETGQCQVSGGTVHFTTSDSRGTIKLASRNKFCFASTITTVRIKSDQENYRSVWHYLAAISHYLGTTHHQWEQFLHHIALGNKLGLARQGAGRITTGEWFNLVTIVTPARIQGEMLGEQLYIENPGTGEELTGPIILGSNDDYSQQGFWLDYIQVRQYLEPEPLVWPETPYDEAREIRQLISELGADEWNTRELATRCLVEMGEIALPYLRESIDNPDMEIMTRIQYILKQINR